MTIDTAEVLRIAKLARLRMEEAEAAALAGDLGRIVEYIDQLREVELPGDAESLTYFDTDVHREDRSGESLAREDALRNAPETDGESFIVPPIVDQGES
jgi:aspartyl-tRNA(Asn)/glutamyl-tRNA(Gln) amidotransferase subunit C